MEFKFLAGLNSCVVCLATQLSICLFYDPAG